MSTAELKYNLVKLIESINDSQTLQAIYTLLSKKAETETDFWNELSNEEKAGIEEGLAQIDRGETIPHEEVMAEIKRKYNL
jgi:predicted transcriptional regulator